MKKSPSPEVSVIVPCYNMGDYIAETIDSVLAQTFENFEIIIVDDCSTDGTTRGVIKKLAKKDKRIKTIYLKENVKLPNARNAGIKQAKAPYILPLDADDLIAPSYLQKMLKLIKKENADVVYCHIQQFGLTDEIHYAPADLTKKLLFHWCISPCSLFKKSDWEGVGGYNSDMINGSEDHDFWLSLLEAGKKFVLLDEALFHYRKYPGSMSTETEKIYDALQRKMKQNHPRLYAWHDYYLNREYVHFIMLPYLRELPLKIRNHRRRLFQMRFRREHKIIRLFGITFLNSN